MNKTKYNIRHVRCNMADFHADRHRFRFEYNDTEYVVPCYQTASVDFDGIKDPIPESVKTEIETIICNKVAKEERNWRYPAEAYAIANAYCATEFN